MHWRAARTRTRGKHALVQQYCTQQTYTTSMPAPHTPICNHMNYTHTWPPQLTNELHTPDNTMWNVRVRKTHPWSGDRKTEFSTCQIYRGWWGRLRGLQQEHRRIERRRRDDINLGRTSFKKRRREVGHPRTSGWGIRCDPHNIWPQEEENPSHACRLIGLERARARDWLYTRTLTDLRWGSEPQ